MNEILTTAQMAAFFADRESMRWYGHPITSDERRVLLQGAVKF